MPVPKNLDRRFDRFSRKKYGLPGRVLLRKLEKGESGGDAGAVSSKGARGRYQFMPQTGAAVRQRYGINAFSPKGNQDRTAAKIHLLGLLGHEKGLKGYNPGMPSYERYILNQKVPTGGGGRPNVRSRPGRVVSTPPSYTPGSRSTNFDDAILDALLTPHKPGTVIQSALRLADSGQYDTVTPAKFTKGRVTTIPGGTGGGGGGGGGSSNSAVSWAQSKVGKAETGGANRGRLPDRLNRKFGMIAQPWCAMFTSMAVTNGGAPQSARSASVAEIRAKASRGDGYHRGGINPRNARPGDLILFGNRHIGLVERVTKNGIVMIAGNDSDKVNRRTVGFGEGDIVRPKYSRRRR